MKIVVKAACGLILTASALPAFAQDGADETYALEEVIVTAQKREQSLQDVPVAVSAYGAATLEKAGIRDIRDVAGLSPSLFLSSSASEAAGAVARIRGVGTTGDNAGLESAVAVFVDGVYRNRNNVALTELGEVERIEVLRGPQGTLFGKNASAGLIHVITRGPDFESSGHLELSGGDFGLFRAEVGLTGPIVDDTAAYRLDAVYSKRDGLLEEINTGTEYNDRDRYLVRGQLLFTPNDNVNIRVIADLADRDETCCAGVTRVAGPTTGIIQLLGGTLRLPPDPFARITSVNDERGYQQDVRDAGLSAEVNWQTSWGQVTSITAVRDWELDRSQDIDYTNADILYRDANGFQQSFETFTQELRVAGQTDSLDWMFGFFYADETLELSDAARTGRDYEGFINGLIGAPNALSLFTNLPPGSVFPEGAGVISDQFEQQADSWALFTHNTWRLSERFALGLGVRYTQESKEFDATLLADNVACPASLAVGAAPAEVIGIICLPLFNPLLDGTYADDRDDEEWTGSLSLSYDLNDDWLGYVSYGRGFKAGGFNLDRAGLDNPLVGAVPEASDLQFEEEGVESYELGLKGWLFDRRLSLNAAIFQSDFEDFQLNSFNGISFVVDNLEGVTSEGLELEFNALVGEYWAVAGGVTFATTEYDNNISNAALAGQQITNAPEESATLSVTYERPLNDRIYGFFHIDGRYNSEINTGSDLDVEKIQSSFTVFNTRLGLQSSNDTWEIELWARNLFDKNYVQVAFDQPLQGSGTGPGSTQTFGAFLGEPRIYGATLRWNF